MADSDTTQQVDVKKLLSEADVKKLLSEAIRAELEALRAERKAIRADRKAIPFLTTAKWTSAILFIGASLVGF